MIKTELINVDEETTLIRTYSDVGKYIIQGDTNAKYEEAVDPIDMHRTYTESDEDIPKVEAPEDMNTIDAEFKEVEN